MTQTEPTRKIANSQLPHLDPAATLARCVGDVDRFFDDHWALRPLLVRASSSSFDDLASLEDLDSMISSLPLRASSLRMIKDGAALPAASYTIPPGAKSRGSERIVSATLVYDRFHEGATIALEGLHRYWRPLTDFSRALELALGHRVQVNAYLTPPGSRGFDVHRDEHDVFVLQVSGAKQWRVYDEELEDEIVIEPTLEQGDALYVPRRWPHAASTQAGASAHLTVGILTHDSIEILRELTKVAEKEPAFAERIDLREARDFETLSAVVERHVEELRTWLDKVDLYELTVGLARRIFSSSQPVVRGQLVQLQHLAAIDEDTRLVRRPGQVCLVRVAAESVIVLLVDRELELPVAAASAIAHVAQHESFDVRDLHAFLDAESALVLARRLVREGLLEVVVV